MKSFISALKFFSDSILTANELQCYGRNKISINPAKDIEINKRG
ncbi:hypothetical protein HNQ88_000697 [Aureibacter tunicatorum]|uniref:Uncharacterized protein n=1 Tax=Aureibacter tunicatorum TaxID=866807 RepID=A0AAE3XL23_9BACT|nr:hypothetical protein [Aureibacter tunicatorum]BDD02756.1 hypothetical protein AUTU_02390 [Aureibacter tunicatorum]